MSNSKLIGAHKAFSSHTLKEIIPLLLYLILPFKAERQDIKKHMYTYDKNSTSPFFLTNWHAELPQISPLGIYYFIIPKHQFLCCEVLE